MKPIRITAVFCALAACSFGEVIKFAAFLDGPSENPPVASPATGFAFVTWDTVAETFRVEATWAGLVGTTTVTHIHCCVDPPGNVGVATTTPTFPGFPVGVTAGSYDMTFDYTDATSFRPGFITDNGGTPETAAAALLAGLQSGRAYFNIHSTFAPSGEIRGFLAEVPEPSTVGLAGVALAGLIALRRRK
jgi:hypothetical protein